MRTKNFVWGREGPGFGAGGGEEKAPERPRIREGIANGFRRVRGREKKKRLLVGRKTKG